MTKRTEYYVIARGTPHTVFSRDGDENTMGIYKNIADAVERVKELRTTAESNAWSPGYEPFQYFIKSVEVVQRGEEEIKGFGKLMQKKLDDNKHKPGWDDDDLERLYQGLYDEAQELKTEIYGWHWTDKQKKRIALEAADVANYAMMIADVALNGNWDAV